MGTKSLYSLSKLKEYLGNDPLQVKEMIRLFLDTIPPELEQLKELAENEDWDTVYKLAHKIRPSFEVFSMDDMLSDVKKVEFLALEKNIQKNIDQHIQKLNTKFLQIVEKLRLELED